MHNKIQYPVTTHLKMHNKQTVSSFLKIYKESPAVSPTAVKCKTRMIRPGSMLQLRLGISSSITSLENQDPSTAGTNDRSCYIFTALKKCHFEKQSYQQLLENRQFENLKDYSGKVIFWTVKRQDCADFHFEIMRSFFLNNY